MTYEEKRAQMLANSENRKEEEKREFLSKLNKVIINNDGWKPYIAKLIETKKGYTDYTIFRHPTGIMTYHVTFYDNNRNCGRSGEYFHGDIPKVHKAQFAELEQMFD